MQQVCPPQQNNRVNQSTQPSHNIELNGATLNQVDVSYNLKAGNIQKKAENKLAQSANTSGSNWPGVGQFTKQGDTLVFTPADNIQGSVTVTINGKKTEIQVGSDLGAAAIRRNDLAQPQRQAPQREIERPLPPPPAERKPHTTPPQVQQPLAFKFSPDFAASGASRGVAVNPIPAGSSLHGQLDRLRQQGLDITLSGYSQSNATFRVQSADGRNSFQEIHLNPCAPGYSRNRDAALAGLAQKYIDLAARDAEQKLPAGTSAVAARVAEINKVLKSPGLAQSMASLPEKGKGRQEQWETYFNGKIAAINQTASEPVTPESVAKLNGLVAHLEKSAGVLQNFGHRPGVSTAKAEEFFKNNVISETALSESIRGSRNPLGSIVEPLSKELSNPAQVSERIQELLKSQIASGKLIAAADSSVNILKDGAIHSVSRESLSPAVNGFIDHLHQRNAQYGGYTQLENKVAPLKEIHTNAEILLTPGGELVLRAFNKETAQLDHFAMNIDGREFGPRDGQAYSQATGKWKQVPAQEHDFNRYMPGKDKKYVDGKVENQILSSGLHSTATAKVVEWHLSSSSTDASLNGIYTVESFDRKLMANQGQMKLAPQPAVLREYWDSLLNELANNKDHSVDVPAGLLNDASPVSHGSVKLERVETDKGPAIKFTNHL